MSTQVTAITTDPVHLQQEMRRLERENAEIRQALASVQSERDEYLRSLYAWAREQFSGPDEEGWRVIMNESSLPLEQIIAEVERESILEQSEAS